MECNNHNMEFVKRRKSDGNPLLNKQCLSCGEKDSKAYKLNLVSNFESLPVWREDLIDFYYENKRKTAIKEREIDRVYWLENTHKKYLQSDKWMNKRAKVLARDNYVCQACVTNKASQVHHLNYRNYGDEPLFDLVSVCVPCHNKIHNK